ncbi:hypothetical protein [Candidatus Binatus sp.]|uniref:hypothetical protein n=1 Tax=Candidatus Binatus sp. TaxID=2811406 RepID=UPI003CBC7368
MLGYRKRYFDLAHTTLQRLRADPEDLATLKEIQKLLLREVVRTEKKIREHKAELKTSKGTADSTAAKRSAYLGKRIEGFRQCAYIWRCFGDAIAFLYMDKFALKHCFYSTENTSAKYDAGFILGKEGLGKELQLLDSALEDNIPALLVDLTNTIRHGDVCLMGESDPLLIEVKSSKGLDSRGRKQRRSLEKLQTFYDTDKGEGLRGFPQLRRQAYEMPERSYVDQINECIAQALKDGYAVRQPEHGLYYIVMTQEGLGLEQILDTLALKAPWAFFLNTPKSVRTWAPYLPFILTIEDKDHLWDFIRGNLHILVLVESDALCQIAIDKGCKAKIDLDDEDYPLHVEVPGGDRMAGISGHILTRIGMEFVSPEWMVLCSIEGLRRLSEGLKAESGAAPSP